MPRTKKPAGVAADPRNGRRAELQVVAGEKFDPPAAVSEETKALWESYWDDRVSGVATPADRSVMLRWITAMDRYLRTSAEADTCPLVEGSQGQMVMNPLYKVAQLAEDTVKRCEEQLGIGGLNRSHLGIAVIAEQKSLADMNARYGGGDVDAGPAVTRSDPRVIDA